MDGPRHSAGERGRTKDERRDKRETKPCRGSSRRRHPAEGIQRSGETAPLVIARLIVQELELCSARALRRVEDGRARLAWQAPKTNPPGRGVRDPPPRGTT